MNSYVSKIIEYYEDTMIHYLSNYGTMDMLLYILQR